jgi:hypothetical protein
MGLPPVVALFPSGWAIKFDGTEHCGRVIAERLWPDISETARAQRWAFQTKAATTWSNPDENRGPLSGDAGDWIASYGNRHHVVHRLPPDWLGGVTALTRNILDEWERR